MINKSNYEAFALDYLEGNLSATERREMEVFLQNHPEIAEELAMMGEMVTLVPDETVVFENKNALLKSEDGAKVIPIVIGMHRRTWFRMSIAAAAMLLLIGGYLAGYFTASSEIGKEIIVKTPDKKVEDVEKIEEKEVLVIDEDVLENEEMTAPIPEKMEQKNTSKSIDSTPNKNVEKHEAVAENETKVKKSAPIVEKPKQSIFPPTNLEKEEETAIANEEIIEPTPKKVIPPTYEIDTEITIATLPKEEIAISQIPQKNSIENVLEEVAQPIAMNENSNEEMEAEEDSKGKKTLRKIGRFFGKLPFEGATASLIPTYYTDKKSK